MQEPDHVAATDGICKSDKQICRKTLSRRTTKVNAGIVKNLSLSCQLHGAKPFQGIDRTSQRRYCTVTATDFDAMPFATTSRVPAPVSMLAGTSKCVDTGLVLVATAMVL